MPIRFAVAEISLAVTKAVLDYTKGSGKKEHQIAYSAASADIATRLGEALNRST